MATLQIFVTWTERRAWLKTFGTPTAALWIREGTRDDYRKAQAYAAQEHKRGGDHRVYATCKYELFAVAKAAALASHIVD